MNRKSRRTAAKQLRSSDFKGTDVKTVALLLDQAITAAQAGKWTDAEKILHHLLQVDPDHAEASHMMGMALGSTGRVAEGIEYLKKATKQKPGEALYWNNLATCYCAAHQFAEAVDAARKAVTIEPGYAVAWSRLGDSLSDIKDFASARDAYERYKVLAGADLGVEKRIANCLINLGQLSEAETCLKALRAQAPDDTEVLGNLGAVLVARRQFAEALPCLETAATADRKKYSLAFNYARALEGTGEIGSAIQWLRRATSIEHRSGEAWLLLGELLLQTGEIDEALVSAKRAAAFRPGEEATSLMRRVEAARNPAAAIAPTTTPAKPSPVMWDFHLGDDAPAPAAGGPIAVDFVNQPKTNGVHAKEAEAPKPKPVAAGGIVDLTVLKIG